MVTLPTVVLDCLDSCPVLSRLSRCYRMSVDCHHHHHRCCTMRQRRWWCCSVDWNYCHHQHPNHLHHRSLVHCLASNCSSWRWTSWRPSSMKWNYCCPHFRFLRSKCLSYVHHHHRRYTFARLALVCETWLVDFGTKPAPESSEQYSVDNKC